MKKILLFIPFILGCNNNSNQPVVVNEIGYELFEEDSIASMLDIINFVDSANVVENVSNNIIELKKENEKLESNLEQTREQLESVREELIETKVALVESERIIKTISSDSADGSAGFELLPIKK